MKPINELIIAMASDHAGFGLKSMIQLYLEREGAKVVDFGCNSMDNCDFPDFAHPMATAVEKGECDLGLGFCHTRFPADGSTYVRMGVSSHAHTVTGETEADT